MNAQSLQSAKISCFDHCEGDGMTEAVTTEPVYFAGWYRGRGQNWWKANEAPTRSAALDGLLDVARRLGSGDLIVLRVGEHPNDPPRRPHP
jgi:hypothetical protein